MRCYIAGAGEFDESTLPKGDDFIIAADGGLLYLHERGIEPDLIVGDFDSLPTKLTDVVAGHPNVIRVSSIKDDTDMMLAVREGLKLGYTEFAINGALGGRLDQTYANIQILTFITSQGASATLYSQYNRITAIKDNSITLNERNTKGKSISVFCAGDSAQGVTLDGLLYPLKNANITNAFPIGVSNEFTDKPAVISVKTGTLIIIWEK
ncbi:MAG: thiamine diphosphokinase [Oscillospiraceae bacterium]|nr:thiamine diphosphokinase [Oscillospiraceae bacterium]